MNRGMLGAASGVVEADDAATLVADRPGAATPSRDVIPAAASATARVMSSRVMRRERRGVVNGIRKPRDMAPSSMNGDVPNGAAASGRRCVRRYARKTPRGGLIAA